MLFVPSMDEIPHEECELTSDEDLLADVEPLTGVLTRRVEEDLEGWG